MSSPATSEPSSGIKIPRYARNVNYRSLTPMGKLILNVLDISANGSEYISFQSDELSRSIVADHKTVLGHLRQLESCGFIERTELRPKLRIRLTDKVRVR